MEGTAQTHAPTASELRDRPVVQAALEEAWHDSKPHDPDTRHEEGGWIYINLSTGEITVRRAAAGFQSEVNLANPPHVTGHVVVGVFHTHPNLSAEGWEPGKEPYEQRSTTRAAAFVR